MLSSIASLPRQPTPRPTTDAHFRLAGRRPLLDGPLFYALLPFRVARELREFHPDAVLVQGVHEAVAVLVARRVVHSRTRVILDVQGDWHEATRLYGSPFRRLLNPVNDALAPVAVRRVDAVRTVSTQTTGLVRALGVEPAAVFPSYVDADVFLSRPLAPLPERPSAVFVGVLERYKAFDTLLDAWPRVTQRIPDALLHIVGDGSMKDRAARLLADFPDQVIWSSRLRADQVAHTMDDSWLVCLPSRSEGLPRVALEAACRGRAIVGGNRAGIPDVVRDGENGLLVDPDDADGLADALARILGDRAEAERLGAAARRTGEEWSVTPEEYGAKLEALVERSPREMTDRDILYFNTWYRGHNNARYSELLPRLERVRPYLLTFPRPRLVRAASDRAWRAVRGPLQPVVLRRIERRHPYALVTDLQQLETLTVPVMVDIDDLDFTEANGELLRRGNVVAYTVTDDSAAHQLEALGVERPWYVIPQGVALDQLDPEEVTRIARLREGVPVVGYIAAFLQSEDDRGGGKAIYNIDHLLAMWDEIRARVPAARLWLVGNASKAVQSRLARRPDVTLFGHVPRGRLLAIASNFDVALYPREHDPGIRASKVAEYFGMGVPIVGYDHEVVQDVRDARAGILVPDARAFVDAVEHLLTDEAERRGLAEAARIAGAERDWRKLSARYAELLDRHLPPLH